MMVVMVGGRPWERDETVHAEGQFVAGVGVHRFQSLENDPEHVSRDVQVGT